ncbi:zinc-binding dehydrogenase [Streptomyces finlayi]|uniref:zinc-binding dehydrogenase n=1 Tax=Streptomyces finlayi TaxID=67296 RepID=UPI00167B791E|nr:zinc-binding dehydrogenase [Streptomyces finlayi]
MYDGTCPACLRGEPNLCVQFGFLGLMGGGGGLAEYAVVPAGRAHVLPEGVSTETAALVEPLAVAWHAVRRGGLTEGGSVAVVGAGPIGLGLLLAAKAQGAGFVAVSEIDAARRELALGLGADLAVDPTEQDAAAEVLARVPGGVDAAFEASGAGRAAVDTLLAVVRKGGRAVTVAQGGTAELDPTALMVNEIVYTGSFAYDATDFPAVITALADGRLREESLTALVTDRIPLDRADEDGYRELLARGGAHVKILVRADAADAADSAASGA